MVLEQVIFAGTANDLPATTTEYIQPDGAGSSWGSTEANEEHIVSSAITIKKFRVELTGSPGAGNSYTFTLRKNEAATDVVVVISDSETEGSDTVNTASFVAGDLISIQVVPVSTPDVARASWSFVATSANTTDSVLMSGTANDLPATTTEYNALNGGDLWTSSESQRETLVSRSGTIKNLYIELENDVGTSPNDFVFTVRKNGAPTDLAVTITTGSITGNNIADSFTVVAGDSVTIQVNPNSSPTVGHAFWGVTFVSDTDNEYIVLGQTSSDLDSAATEYVYFNTGNDFWGSTEANEEILGQANVTIKNFYMELTGSPGAGNSYTFNARKNVGNAGLQVVLSDAETADNNTADTFDVADFDSLSLQVIPASTPTARDAKWGFTVNTGAAVVTNTKTFTVDALLKATLTKTFTADAILKATQTKEFTVDALLQATFTKTFTVDAILQAVQTKTFTVDALLKATLTKDFTADAILQAIQSKTFEADALLKATLTKTFTTDAILIATKTKTFTADAILVSIVTKTFTADAILKVTRTKTFTADALLHVPKVQELTATMKDRTFSALLKDRTISVRVKDRDETIKTKNIAFIVKLKDRTFTVKLKIDDQNYG